MWHRDHCEWNRSICGKICYLSLDYICSFNINHAGAFFSTSKYIWYCLYVSNVIWCWCAKCCGKIEIGEMTIKQNTLIAQTRFMNTSYTQKSYHGYRICDHQGPRDNFIYSMGYVYVLQLVILDGDTFWEWILKPNARNECYRIMYVQPCLS